MKTIKKLKKKIQNVKKRVFSPYKTQFFFQTEIYRARYFFKKKKVHFRSKLIKRHIFSTPRLHISTFFQNRHALILYVMVLLFDCIYMKFYFFLNAILTVARTGFLCHMHFAIHFRQSVFVVDLKSS